MEEKVFATVHTEVTFKEIADLLSSAIEGSVSVAWAELVDEKEPTIWTYNSKIGENDTNHYLSDYPLNEGGSITLKDIEAEEEKEYILDLEAVRKGLDLFAKSKEYRHHYADFIQNNGDAITGDVFLQFCLFGEVLYS